MKKIAPRGTTARRNRPRNPSVDFANPWITAVRPVPTPYPAAMRAIALARSLESVSSAALTWARALVALRWGRPRAKMTTNHQ